MVETATFLTRSSAYLWRMANALLVQADVLNDLMCARPRCVPSISQGSTDQLI